MGEGILIKRRTRGLPLHGAVRIRPHPQRAQLIQYVCVRASSDSGCIDIFHAHQPLSTMRARIQPACQGGNQRARMQRAGG